MEIAVDISLYPLADMFTEPIDDVIARLKQCEDIDVTTNPMSTQLRGEYGAVMRAVEVAMKVTFENLPKAVFVLKVVNNPMEAGAEFDR